MRRLFYLLLILALPVVAQRVSENLILVTADGLRTQEVFSGIDPLLMVSEEAGMKDAEAVRKEFWRDSAEQRRAALLPFLWGTLAREGVILGNREKGSVVRVSNGIRVSYPGYSEILTGRTQDDVIRGNDRVQNPTPSFLEFLRERWKISRSSAAVFGSWDLFGFISQSKPGALFVNSGFEALAAGPRSSRLEELSRRQFEMLTPWRSVRHDYVTCEMALEYLRVEKPRLLYVALGETDDWAHDRRYDRVVETARYFDSCLGRIWDLAQRLPSHRGKTTLAVTTDHGRGKTLEDWHGHGSRIDEAQYIWMAFVGPGTPPRGEAENVAEVFQRDLAPTLLELVGVGFEEYAGVTGRPIGVAIGR